MSLPVGPSRKRLAEVRLRDLALLAVASAYWPLSVMASNLYGIVHPERLMGVAALVWVLTSLAYLLLVKLRVRSAVAVNCCFVGTVIFMSGGALIREIDAWFGWLLLAGLCLLAVEILRRLGDDRLGSLAILSLAVALAALPVVNLVRSINELGRSSVLQQPTSKVTFVTRPDVFLVVLDGYPGLIAQQQDDPDPGQFDIREVLPATYQIPLSAWSPYWTTSLAVPAILDMGYPVTGRWSGTATYRDLYEIVADENQLTSALSSNGYEIIHVESGWSGNSCGPHTTTCVPSVIDDEAMFLALRNSIYFPAIDNAGSPFAAGALKSMDWLLDNAESISASTEPQFVFAHVVAPHEPLVLDRECEIRAPEADAAHAAMGADWAQIDQLDCVERFLHELAITIRPDDVVLVVSDHGTNRRGQTNESKVEWDHKAIVERMNVLVAAQLPPSCSLGDEINTANLLGRALSCISDEPIKPNPRRMWINPMRELASNEVEALMALRPADT